MEMRLLELQYSHQILCGLSYLESQKIRRVLSEFWVTAGEVINLYLMASNKRAIFIPIGIGKKCGIFKSFCIEVGDQVNVESERGGFKVPYDFYFCYTGKHWTRSALFR